MGGIFKQENKVRTGPYYRFTGGRGERDLLGTFGVAALPLPLDWGAADTLLSIDADSSTLEFMQKFGRAKVDLLPIRECLKQALTLHVYRVNADGAKAALDMTPQPVIATAKYTGVRGDDVAVQITEDIDNPGTYVVTTYVDAMEQYRQSGVVNGEDIQANDWVDFSGAGPITAAAGGQLTGGTNGTATVNDYNKFLVKLETLAFNAFGLPSNDVLLKPMFVEATRRYNEELGLLVQCFMPDYKQAAYEAVTSLQNGVVLVDGTVIDKAMAVCWYTGASAAADEAKALTYTAYDDALYPDVEFNNLQVINETNTGGVVFIPMTDAYGNDTAVVETDINTFVRTSADKPEDWKKNRVVRALYTLVRRMMRTFSLYYAGKEHNSLPGRMNYKGDVVTIMKHMTEKQAFRPDFDPLVDLVVEQGEKRDAVRTFIGVTPIDAMEKMYITVEVR